MSKPKIQIKCSETGKEKSVSWDLESLKNEDLITYLRSTFKADLTIRATYGSADGFHFQNVNETDPLQKFTVVRDVARDLTYVLKDTEKSGKGSSAAWCCGGGNDVESKIIDLQNLKNNFSAAQFIAKSFETVVLKTLTSAEFVALVISAISQSTGNVEICSFKKTFAVEILDDKYLCFIYAGLRYTTMLDKFYKALKQSMKFKDVNYNIYVSSKGENTVVYLSVTGDITLAGTLSRFDKDPVLVSVPETVVDPSLISLELATKQDLIARIQELTAQNTVLTEEAMALRATSDTVSKRAIEGKLGAETDLNKMKVEKQAQQNELLQMQLQLNITVAKLAAAEEAVATKDQMVSSLSDELASTKDELAKKNDELRRQANDVNMLLEATKKREVAPAAQPAPRTDSRKKKHR